VATKVARKVKSNTGKLQHVPLEERVIYRFFLIAKRFDQALVAMHSKKLGISVNNCKIMRVIAFFGPLSATELGARTSLDPDKITRAVDTLVDRSYVIRKSDEADRRKVVLTLSAKGRRVHDKIEMVVSAMESDFLSALTAEERKALGSSLDKLEQHTSLRFGRREGWYERRHLAGDGSRRIKPDARRPAKQAGRAVSGKLVGAK
jgi:DNA-binding MarR family transcriptional regulator